MADVLAVFHSGKLLVVRVAKLTFLNTGTAVSPCLELEQRQYLEG